MTNPQHTFRVAKFGGTSVANYSAICAAVANVKSQNQPILVVVSACAGVTDRLVMLANESDNVESILSEIVHRHTEIADELSRLNSGGAVEKQLALDGLHDRLRQHVARRPTPHDASFVAWRDQLLSFGEYCSSLLFSWAWEAKTEQPSAVLEAKTWLFTDSRYGRARPQLKAMIEKAPQWLKTLEPGRLYVTQGFIGKNERGQTTTLGRGGSDYSAALLAVVVQAQELQVWTDVAGVYSTDPRLCSDAFAIAEMSFDEAAEMATFGAKVLHPASLLPAIEYQIPVFVGHAAYPARGGTRLVKNSTHKPDVRAVAVRRQQTLMTVHSIDMFHASGFLAQLFSIFAKYDISVDLITTSEVSIALTLDEGGSQANHAVSVPAAAIAEIELFAKVELEYNLTLIALIGNQIGRQSQLSQWVFDAVAPTPVRLICQGASEFNLCFLIPERDTIDVVTRLHARIKR